MTNRLALPADATLLVIDLQRAIDDPRRALEGPRNNPDGGPGGAAARGLARDRQADPPY